jgi:hypothetical protein
MRKGIQPNFLKIKANADRPRILGRPTNMVKINPKKLSIHELSNLGVAVVDSLHHESHSARRIRRHLGVTACVAGAALFTGFLLHRSIRHFVQSAKAHRDWQRKDAQLDEDLDATFDASDPIAKY